MRTLVDDLEDGAEVAPAADIEIPAEVYTAVSTIESFNWNVASWMAALILECGRTGGAVTGERLTVAVGSLEELARLLGQAAKACRTQARLGRDVSRRIRAGYGGA